MLLAEPKKRAQTKAVYQTLAKICALSVSLTPVFGAGVASSFIERIYSLMVPK